jgi:hypothetical protein
MFKTERWRLDWLGPPHAKERHCPQGAERAVVCQSDEMFRVPNAYFLQSSDGPKIIKKWARNPDSITPDLKNEEVG